MSDNYEFKHLKSWAPATYKIKVEGVLDEHWSDRFAGMQIEVLKRKDQSCVTTLTGRLVDQSELTGVLNSLAEMHLPILSVECLAIENDNANAL